MDHHVKQAPVQGVTGLWGGTQGALTSGVSDQTYVDDVFSTYVYEGDGTTSHQIVNGIDLATHGGFIWGKERGNTGSHYQFDTERGLNKRLKSNSDAAEETDTFYSSVNSNGYTINKTTSVNVDGNDYVSWSFRKSAGFFDVITYTGNGNNRTISHNLECIPGCIMVKRTDSGSDWCVWHRRLGIAGRNTGGYGIFLNEPDDKDSDSGYWNNTDPTASVFSVGTSSLTNHDGGSYVAYIFGHGDSSGFCMDASNGNIKINSDNDLDLATDNSTYECWFQVTTLNGLSGSGYNCIFDTRGGTGTNTTGYAVFLDSNGILGVYHNGWHCKTGSTITCSINTWYHVAVVKSSTTITLWVNGVQSGDSGTVASNLSNDFIHLGCGASTSDRLAGKISNFRVSNTTLYNPSYNWVLPEFPLCSEDNTVLLCCDKPNVLEGTTVPDAGISQVHSSPTYATSEFVTDVGSVTAGNVYGADADQNIIKCGRYQGNGVYSKTAGPQINLGWEPAWVLIKNIDSSSTDWVLIDAIRPIEPDSQKYLRPNQSNGDTLNEYLTVYPTGFSLTNTSSSYVNKNGDGYIYIAIRRPDGYVGKPDEAGTDAFNVANYDSTAPAFNANFPVDFALFRRVQQAYDWRVVARLAGLRYMPIQAGGTSNENDYVFDYNDGWNKQTGYANTEVSWMWARGQGFDVVDYRGNGTAGRQISHSMNQTIEMIWTKNRSSTAGWKVWHKDLNGGGANAATWYLALEASTAETANGDIYGSSSAILPTSTYWTVGSNAGVNENGSYHTAMLFSSVTGISKVGSYSGSANAQTITVGFQPRLIIIKRRSTRDWVILDTLRGIGASSGDDKALYFEDNTAQEDQNFLDLTSTGFTLNADLQDVNKSGEDYIYYSHA